jgi:hypothetical protein
VFLLASQTKLLTSVAALQIVERGLIAFDDSVEELLPELAGQKVLTGFEEDGKPVLVERTEKITFRYERAHLLYQRQRRHSVLTILLDTSSPTPQAQPTTAATPSSSNTSPTSAPLPIPAPTSSRASPTL